MRIVFFLHLCTCEHLDSSLLDFLELTGALVLDVAGPRVDGYLGHGALPCLDCPPRPGPLSSFDVGFVVEGVGLASCSPRETPQFR